VGWNTAADGSGFDVKPGVDQLEMESSNIVLYAQWRALLTVTYKGNGNTGGTVPLQKASYMPDVTAVILGNTGNLEKAGYSFTGWNTAANGKGTHIAASGTATFSFKKVSVVLYAEWTKNTVVSTEFSETFTGFEFFKSRLTSDLKREIRTWLNLHKGLTQVSCTGYTGYNSTKASRSALRALGKSRARNVCTYIHKLDKSIKVVEITTVQLTSKSNNSRKVSVTLK
jgi:hypothetical protein